MADVELSWTVPGQSHADLLLGYDSVDANGNAVVTSASGSYQALDSAGNVVRTDQVTGLIAPNSFILAPDDVLNVAGHNPIVDTAGVGVIINNAADADNIGPNNTPEVIFSTDIFGDYRELQKGDAQDVSLAAAGGGGSGGGGGGGGTGGSGGGVEVLTFHPHPSLAEIGHVLGTPKGMEATAQVVNEFGSFADLLGHTTPSANGSSTVIHLPSQQTEIVLKNLTEGEIRTDARFLSHFIF